MGLHDADIFEELNSSTLESDAYTDARDFSFAQKLNIYEQKYTIHHIRDSKAEVNERFPVFIWEEDINNDEKEDILNKLNNQQQTFGESIGAPSIRYNLNKILDFFSYNTGEYDFKEGEWVITTKSNGAYLNFHQFDRIFSDNEKTYAISLKKKRYNRPIDLDSSMKQEIKKIIKSENFKCKFVTTTDFIK